VQLAATEHLGTSVASARGFAHVDAELLGLNRRSLFSAMFSCPAHQVAAMRHTCLQGIACASVVPPAWLLHACPMCSQGHQRASPPATSAMVKHIYNTITTPAAHDAYHHLRHLFGLLFPAGGAPPPAGYPSPPQPQAGAAPGPYPPQQQQQLQQGPPGGSHFAQAPAGYPAMPAGAPPGFEFEKPNKPHEMQQQQGPAAVGYIAPGPGPSPGGAPYGVPLYQQQQQHQGHHPAPGYPVAVPGGMAVVSGPDQAQQEKCGCSIGWVLFGVSCNPRSLM
jgi:hypothetical protein